MGEVSIGCRYRGPLTSANGGYAAGRLAAFLDARAVAVTLRLPPPLDRPLDVVSEGGGALLLDGDAVVAEAVAGVVEVDPPAPISFDAAEEAARRHVRTGADEFSECFTCGVRGDGLCIHVGPVTGTDLHAAPWTATEVAPEIVWAAIDCPGAYAVGGPGRGDVVLGRMTAEIHRLPAEGEQCVVLAWPLGEEGRKLEAGTALYSRDGELLALARQTWIVPRQPDLVA